VESPNTDEKSVRKLVAAVLVAGILPVFHAAPVQAAEPVKRCPKLEKDLRRHGLPVKEFSFYAWRESKCIGRAIGWNYYPGKSHKDCKLVPARQYRKCPAVRSYDLGYLQINSTWVSVTARVCKARRGDLFVLLKKSCNLKVARYLYRHGGSIHWKGTSK
jgi:hypothetical protein